MENIDIEKMVEGATAVIAQTMSRAEKLRHWAEIVLNHATHLFIYSNLERWDAGDLGHKLHEIYGPTIATAFTLAAADPVLQGQGLPAEPTFTQVLGFFEITQVQAHTFSCNCGGQISNTMQADRIASLI